MQRMKAILLRNTRQRQNVFVQHLVTLNSSQNSSKGGLTREIFVQHSKRKFVSLCGHITSSIYSSSKLKTPFKLEVISRYHEVVRSHFLK